MEGGRAKRSAAPEYAAAVRIARRGRARAVVLVEGPSDGVALEILALRAGRDLAAEDVHIVPIGGATSIAHFLELFGPGGSGIRLAGLCDAAEEHHYRRGLERCGLGRTGSRRELEQLGFFVCADDLEDELIRALGTATVEQVIHEAGELGLLRTFQRQPAQRARTREQQLHRFMGTQSGRKVEYARLLADRLDLGRLPHPMGSLLSQL